MLYQHVPGHFKPSILSTRLFLLNAENVENVGEGMNLYMPPGIKVFIVFLSFNIENVVSPDFASKSVKPSDRQ